MFYVIREEDCLEKISEILNQIRAQDQYDDNETTGTAVITRDQVDLKEPSMYVVLLHNDDYTPMDFVIGILKSVFNMDETRAQKVTLDVHQKGVGRCGVYPFEIAETKVALVEQAASEQEFPLKCTYEQS